MQGWAKGRVCGLLGYFLGRGLGNIGVPGALIPGLLPEEVAGLGLCAHRALGVVSWDQMWFRVLKWLGKALAQGRASPLG